MTALHRLRELLPRNTWKLLVLAFAAGLLLFLLLWWDQRNSNDFYKASQPADSAAGSVELPAPLPPDVAPGGIQLSPARPDAAATDEPQPRLINEPKPEPLHPAAAADDNLPAAGADHTLPIPLNNPPPRYPRRAQRRGIEGTVRVRVSVDVDGRVERLELSQTSGNRDLDRAALEAVRRWRFKPAVRNGRPIRAEADIPIVFKLGQ